MRVVERKVGAAAWTERNVRALMSSIAEDREYFARTDRQSAEQATYALLSLSAQLVKTNPRLARSETVAAVDELYRSLDRSRFPDEFDHEAFSKGLERLEQSLR
jgi:hypothetical protein